MNERRKRERRPMVAVPADCRDLNGHDYHVVGDKYLRAVSEVAECMPIVIPAMAESHDPKELVQQVDGILFTGSPSNVHPSFYDSEPTEVHEPYDHARDATNFPLIDAVLDAGLPALFICRGFQELNVHFGGTLHPAIHTLPGKLNHRSPESDDSDVRYGPAHAINFVADGAFAKIAGTTQIMANTVHSQGLLDVSERLTVEGVAPDGTPEAVAVKNAKNFALGVQWHPEYKPQDNEFSMRLFTAFGDAVRRYAAK